MQGHNVEQNRPTLVKAYTLVSPVEKMPISKATIAKAEKINSWVAGFPLLKKSPIIKAIMIKL
jgi:hypothetical protein